MTDDADATAEEPTEEAEPGVDSSETAVDTETEPESADTEPSIVERVATHEEKLAEDLTEALQAERAEFTEEIEELEGKLARKQADFQNFKKRQKQKLADQQARATEELVEKLLPVRDNLARALEQDGDATIREGVEGTLRELDQILEDEGAIRIEPELGDDPDPERHEVLMRVESDQPPGTVAELYRPGYEMGDRVVRTAQVTVSEE